MALPGKSIFGILNFEQDNFPDGFFEPPPVRRAHHTVPGGRPGQPPRPTPHAGARHVTPDRLRAFSLFDGVPDSRLRDLTGVMERQPVPRGDIVYARGDTSREVYFVLSGEFVGYMLSDSGREVAVAQMRTGDHFGETDALSGSGRDVTVQAVTDAELLRVGHADFNLWINEHPSISRNLLGILSARVRHLNDALFSFAVHRVDTRVRLKLAEIFRAQDAWHPGGTLDPAPSHSAIAAEVGANREAVSRVLSSLAKAGLLETGRRRMRVVDPAGVERGL